MVMMPASTNSRAPRLALAREMGTHLLIVSRLGQQVSSLFAWPTMAM